MVILKGSKVYDNENNEYEVKEVIGSGGFGIVFKIENEDSTLALKVLQTNLTDPKEFKSFVNEAKNALKIRHENVIKYLFFNDGNKIIDLPPYIIMEFAKDGSLRSYLDKLKDYLTNSELSNIFSQLVNGMKEISKKFVHRDIKPENILLSNSILKITDFGLSKIASERTRSTTFKGWGSFPYKAPESWKFEKNTVQMDIYSIGLVFYELCTLTFPLKVDYDDYENWKNAHYFQIPENVNTINPEVANVLSRLVMRMIDKDVSKRPKDWEEIGNIIAKEKSSSSDNSTLIDKILLKRSEREHSASVERMKKEKRNNEIIEFKNIILFQLHHDIIDPIKQFIEEINNMSDGEKINYYFDSHSFLNTIEYLNNTIKIDLQPIIEEDFYREVRFKDYGRIHTRTQLRLPKINNRKVIAWGYLKANDGKGFNLILLEKDNSIYGNWIFLVNRHNAIVDKKDNRPEPFPFEFSEIEEEIQYLNAMHIYVTDRIDLDLEVISEFISDYL